MPELAKKKPETVCYDEWDKYRMIKLSGAQEKWDHQDLMRLKTVMDYCTNAVSIQSPQEKERFKEAGKQLRLWIKALVPEGSSNA